ncbi:Ribulose-5-phosphate 4-epimerase [Clostridiaceae bacterium JG1575]|nr:Ribulose-5-phosphate 4-epimerase [Clostridiaceae bacterium JG1575]
MKLQRERALLVAYGKKMLQDHLTTGTGGNLSIYCPEEGLIAITPSGVDYQKMKPRDIFLMRPNGEVVQGPKRHQPTSESALHLALYAKRPDVKAVCHTHSLYCVALAVCHTPLSPIHYLMAMGGSAVRVAPYATYGTEELAEHCVEAIQGDHAVLLANHGLITVGVTLEEAYARAQQLEFVARLQVLTQGAGAPKALSEEEMARVRTRFHSHPYHS